MQRQLLLGLALSRGMGVAFWARTLPQAPALISDEHGTRSFAELNARSNQLARALRRRGLMAGDSVALMCSNRFEFAEVFWATRRTGLRFTPINWHLTADEAAYITTDCDARVLLV
ncbi:MAG TPA: AMP-binding protein, partial [Rhizobacter sp.]|nr:AMP-binding protein [Rhizobacter sp.]